MLDDIWPISSCVDGYLPKLRGILSGNPGSRIALTTRSRLIRAGIGSHVDFGAREPLGHIAVSIFMMHATPGNTTSFGTGEQLSPALKSGDGSRCGLSSRSWL